MPAIQRPLVRHAGGRQEKDQATQDHRSTGLWWLNGASVSLDSRCCGAKVEGGIWLHSVLLRLSGSIRLPTLWYRMWPDSAKLLSSDWCSCICPEDHILVAMGWSTPYLDLYIDFHPFHLCLFSVITSHVVSDVKLVRCLNMGLVHLQKFQMSLQMQERSINGH